MFIIYNTCYCIQELPCSIPGTVLTARQDVESMNNKITEILGYRKSKYQPHSLYDTVIVICHMRAVTAQEQQTQTQILGHLFLFVGGKEASLS